MRATNMILNLMSLGLVAVGLGLVSTFFLGPFLPGADAADETAAAQQSGFNVPTPEEVSAAQASAPQPASQSAPQQSASQSSGEVAGESHEPTAPEAPEDKSLRLTIPAMSRIQDDAIPYAAGDNSEALRKSAAIHLRGTGYPWQEEANVYIAGHRIGYPSTPSFRTFYNLDKLEKGNEVILTDSTGERYVYRVFRKFATGPGDLSVTKPVSGKNVVTLQTCTLPFYTERLIVRAEKVA